MVRRFLVVVFGIIVFSGWCTDSVCRIMDHGDFSPDFLRKNAALRETPPSHRSLRILRKKYGLRPLSRTLKIKKFSRFVDLTSLCDPVRNQGKINSCAAHAAATAMYVASSSLKTLKKKISFSRLFIYYNSRRIENNIQNDTGIFYIGDVLLSLRQYGVPPETTWPYSDVTQRFDDLPPNKAFQLALNYKNRDSVINEIPKNVYAFKEVLSHKRPIIFGIPLYESFFNDNVTLTGQVLMPNLNGQDDYVCRHSMLIVGYDDQKKKFKIRNSWGIEWGDYGYCWVPYSYILKFGSNFYTISNIGKGK